MTQMAFLTLISQDGETVYLDPARIEAVISEVNGARIRTTSRTVYHVTQQPESVLNRMAQAAIAMDSAYFNSGPYVSD